MNATLVACHLLDAKRPIGRRAFARAAREAELDPEQRALLARILSAEVRRRATWRVLAEHCATRPLRPAVATFARVGLARLVTELAAARGDATAGERAIRETVESAQSSLGGKPAAALQALLARARLHVRPGATGDPRRDLALLDVAFAQPVFPDPAAHWLLWAEQALALPVPLGRRWRNRFGSETAARMALDMLVAADVSILVRDVETARGELADFAPRDGGHPRVLRVAAEARAALRATDLVRRGDAVRAGATAVRAADLLGAADGERVLHLDARARTADPVLAASGARVERASTPENTSAAPLDAVLVTPPSSDSGVLAERPGARWRFDPARAQQLAALQTDWLARAAALVAPGGRLVYATRSVEPDENQRRVRAFLANESGWTLAAEIDALPVGPGASGPVDGGYAARLERV